MQISFQTFFWTLASQLLSLTNSLTYSLSLSLLSLLSLYSLFVYSARFPTPSPRPDGPMGWRGSKCTYVQARIIIINYYQKEKPSQENL